MIPASRAKPRTRGGFTLVELMVAMLAGSITVAAAYYLNTTSVRAIGDQMRASDTQMSLRMAMDQVRRDFGRAAYLGTRDSSALPGLACGVPTSSAGQIRTGNVMINGSAGALAVLNPATNLTRADLVTLDGSFSSGSMFLVDNTVVQGPNDVGLDPTRPSFIAAFSPPVACPTPTAVGVFDNDRFNDVFRPGRVLRFENGGNFWFRVITGRNGTPAVPTITLDSALPDVGCAARGSSYVSVVSRIQYSLEAIPSAPGSDIANLTTPLLGGTASVGSQTRAALVRRELNFPGNAAVPALTSVVLDNAVEFQVNGIINTTPGAMPTFAVVDSTTPTTIQVQSTLNPGSLRSFIVTLSARSMEGDRVRGHLPRTALTLPMLTFQMGTSPADANYFVARVKTMRSEIFLPNAVN